MTELELLSKRLCALESRLNRMKLVAAIACAALVAFGFISQAPQPIPRVPVPRGGIEGRTEPGPAVEGEVRARRIILVDYRGQERASLVSDNAGSAFLVMSDSKGKSRMNLSVGNDGPALTFFDPSGQARTILGSTTMVPSHVNNNGVAELAPPSSLVLFDNKGKLLFRTP